MMDFRKSMPGQFNLATFTDNLREERDKQLNFLGRIGRPGLAQGDGLLVNEDVSIAMTQARIEILEQMIGDLEWYQQSTPAHLFRSQG